ncbi:MAG: hypothetical protein GYB30_05655 [Gammaproteobacteria bacterium]|nr:hypothetical protein [Gammaproteobacteria bacterium]
MGLFSNPWIVGIVGGVLSGLIVTAITRYLFNKKDNREYMQKVAAVNREIIYAVRPGISEGHIPDNDVLTALANSTSRKYKVRREDVYHTKHIAEELIKEIMDSSFISSETKKSYCDTLSHLIKEASSGLNSMSEDADEKAVEYEYRQKLVARMSAVLGLSTAIITMGMVYQKFLGTSNFDSPAEMSLKLLVPTIAALLSIMVVMAGMLSLVRLRNIKENFQTSVESK